MPKVGSKRSSNGRQPAPKAQKLDASPPVESADEGIFVDPMIDVQPSDDDMSDADESVVDDASIGSEDDGDDGLDMVEDAAAEDEEHQQQQPTAGPSKPKHRDLYAPPTLEELDTLSSSTSTSFNLQLSALLSSTLLPLTPHSSLKTVLTEIHTAINAIPDGQAVAPKDGIRAMGLPTISPTESYPKKVNWTVGYEKPAEVFVRGSWSVAGGYKRGKGEQGGVDMVITMPETLFTPKDRLDYRYFYKRAYYLGVVKAGLEMSKAKALKGAIIEWETEDARRPVVAITVGKEQRLKYTLTIRLHASPPNNLFPPSSLSPTRSLIRHENLSETTTTPLYSTSILHDTLHKSTLLHLHRLSTTLADRTVDSFLALWRVWCSRRGIARDRGGSGWFAGMILGWVVDGGEVGRKGIKRRGLGKGLGHWGALRAGWEFLAQTDFSKDPIFMACDEPAIPREEMLRSYDQVFTDPTGSINLLAGWDQGDLDLLRSHARETLVMLEDSSVDCFAEVFLRNHTLSMGVFDDVFQVDTTDARISDDLKSRCELPTSSARLIAHISPILRKALSDRITLLHLAPSPSGLTIGLIYNPSLATRVLDVGPSSNQTAETEAFRALWGEKAELRRFKDGSIAESIVWDIARPEEASRIPGRIVQYILSRHLGLDGESDSDIKVLSTDQSWSSILQVPSDAREGVSVPGAEKLGFRPVMESYEELYKLLKAIDDELPLSILNVMPTSEMLRYSTPFIPHPIDFARHASAPACLKHLPAADIILQFESSPRWPDDLSAIQKVKMALLEKLGALIESQLRGSRTSMVFDTQYSEIEDHISLEVLVPKGVAFRLRVYHEKEKSLLERSLEDQKPAFGTALPTPPRKLVLPALEKHLYRFAYAPKHHSGLAPLHHRYPSFSTASRLVKRWISAHMLSTQIPNEAIELLVAAVYLDPGALSAPSSGTTGFMRTIKKLVEWDWRSDPVIVPLYADREGGRAKFGAEQRRQAVELFAKRGPQTHRSWCIATEADLEGYRFTKDITRVIAARVNGLARATLQAVEESVTLSQGINVPSLFTTPLADYNVLLHLKPSIISTYAQAVQPNSNEWEATKTFRNLGSTKPQVMVDFDPVSSFVSDLQRIYSDTFLVFYDRHGGSVIGLLWNPEKETPRALKAFLSYSTCPAGGEAALVTINKEAVLGEIARLGNGLIERIERRS